MQLDVGINTVTNARVLDVETATVSEPTTVTINGERVSEVGDHNVSAGSQSFDAEGRIVSPGLYPATRPSSAAERGQRPEN